MILSIRRSLYFSLRLICNYEESDVVPSRKSGDSDITNYVKIGFLAMQYVIQTPKLVWIAKIYDTFTSIY